MNVSAVTSREYTPEPASARQVARLTTSPFRHILERAHDTAPDSAACTVKRGDTLWGLCEAHLSRSGGTPTARVISAAVDRVAETNNLSNPDLIFVGQRVDLSALHQAPAPKTVPPVQSAQWTGSPPPLVPREPAAAVALVARDIEEAASVVRSILQARPVAPSAALSSLTAPKSDSPWTRVLGDTGRLTSEFGMRKDPFTGRPQHHNGIDIAAETGTAILPYKSGQVTFSGWNAGYGKTVIVRHDDGTETVYSHASQVLAGVGDRVDTDDAIALVGSTGRSTGPHLHFELRKHGRAVDPVPLLSKELQVAQAL